MLVVVLIGVGEVMVVKMVEEKVVVGDGLGGGATMVIGWREGGGGVSDWKRGGNT